MKTLRLTIFLVMACTLVLLASQSAFGAIKIVSFHVPSCEGPVTETWARDALWRLKGVKDVDSNWMLHTMKVTYEDQVTNFEAIVKELSKAGFEVDSKPEYLEPKEPEGDAVGAGSCLPPRYYIFDLLVTAETEPSRPVA